MRYADTVRHGTRVLNVLPSATGTLLLNCDAVVIKLHRHTNDIVALLFQQGGRDRTVHTARHGNNNARVFRPTGKVETVQAGRFVKGQSGHGQRWFKPIGCRGGCALKHIFTRQKMPDRQEYRRG